MKLIVAFVFVTTLVGFVKCDCNGAGTCDDDITVTNSPNNATCGHTTCGSTCDYWCNEGYARSIDDMTRNEDGSYTAECVYHNFGDEGDDTYWDAMCEAVTCDNSDLNIPDESTTNCSDTSSTNYDGTCEIVCNEGYVLTSGSSVVTCGYGTGTSGNWGQVDAVCEAACNENIIYVTNSPNNATCGDTTCGSTCDYWCNEGYARNNYDMTRNEDGSYTAECVYDASQDQTYWDANCGAITCENSLLNIPGGSTTNCSDTGSTNYDETCEIDCNEGYALTSGSSVVTCGYGTGTSGNWSEVKAVCEASICTYQPTITNGDASSCTNTEYNSTCKFTCDTGYGNDNAPYSKNEYTATCTDNTDETNNGAWWDIGCFATTCEPSSTIANGDATSCTNTEYGSTCKFTCDTGYGNDNAPYLNNEYTATCKDNTDGTTDGVWEDIGCFATTCEPLSTIANGDASSCTNTVYNATCKFTCDTGYGNDDAPYSNNEYTDTCKDNTDGTTNGVWGDIGCSATICESQPTLTHGDATGCTDTEYESTCKFTCDTGYGNDDAPHSNNEYTAICLDNTDGTTNGVWEDIGCYAITCDNSALNIPDESTTNCSETGSTNYAETCEIVCNEGYVLTSGSSVVTCGHGTSTGGNWSEVDAVCEEEMLSSGGSGCSTWCIVSIVIGAMILVALIFILGIFVGRRTVTSSPEDLKMSDMQEESEPKPPLYENQVIYEEAK